ncbi:MAG: IS66 family insertion sequence element accessory protein TnpB, partial [Akkermansia sp.]|nr:IS66 family insertion sequence element accessory protein TnpB [Akkermansia sp.]
LSQPMAKGCFFLFINKPHTLLKAVWFDGTGLCLFSKRLEQGQFSWPQTATMSDEKWLQIQPSALTLLLDGIELKNCMKKAWHEV